VRTFGVEIIGRPRHVTDGAVLDAERLPQFRWVDHMHLVELEQHGSPRGERSRVIEHGGAGAEKSEVAEIDVLEHLERPDA